MGRASILVVDDSATIRHILQNTLEDSEFNVALACNGQEALDWADRNPPADLVVTDLHMPEVDGIELVGRLRRQDDYVRCPIFVLTRGADGDEKERMRAAGATAWIVKPFDKDKLVNAIRKVVAGPDAMRWVPAVRDPAPRHAPITYI